MAEMSTRPAGVLLSLQEYVMLEEHTHLKFEYFRGIVRAMSGASRAHILIAQNLAFSLHAKLPNCRAYTSDLRVKTPSGLWTYPDVVLTCGLEEIVEPAETVANPILIAEVLSESTADYDRGEKFELYRSVRSLRDYLLIEQDGIDVEHRWRDGELWRTFRYTSQEDEIRLTGVALTLHVRDLFTGTATP